MDGLRPDDRSALHVSTISGAAFLLAASALAVPHLSTAEGSLFGGQML
jgi:hypothetical protein